MDDLLNVHPEVALALARGGAVVALESTLLAHGMPPDRRVQVARLLEDEVRGVGAVPAVIAVVDGRIQVGVDHALLDRLCHAPGVTKCAERDLALAVARGGLHATTVSSTMFAAHRAGIAVFATGGIGGVHREAQRTFDESQDIPALANHPVAVISAGAKAILDLPRTLERLETYGVPVVGYRCDEFPAFYTRHSGLPLEHRVDDVATLARVVHARFKRLGQGGILVCNPVPEENAMDPTLIQAALEAALAEAADRNVTGKALTPFLLAALERITGGNSVETNIALALNNARLGAALAVELMRVSSTVSP
jgi:pseudouridine-5'-phosphate glycosidase